MYFIKNEDLLGIHISTTDTKTSFLSSTSSVFDFAKEYSIKTFAIFSPGKLDFLLQTETQVQKNEDCNVFLHSDYKHNPCSLEEKQIQWSASFLTKEAMLCEKLNIKFLVFHPGSNLNKGNEEKRLKSLNNMCDFFETYSKKKIKTILLMENSCGSGSNLFSTPNDFKYVFDNISEEAKKIVGICLDTCHLFQAGYNICEKNVIYDLFEELQLISGNRVFLFHLNNSKLDLNCKTDRHEKILDGKMDLSFFIYTSKLSDKYNIPMILETPGNTFNRIGERKKLLSLS